MSESTTSSNSSSGFSYASDKVKVFIRSPTTPLPDDFSVLTSLDSSVLTLKQAIFETLSTKPVVKDQKLIYRGRVLDDKDIILNILRNGPETDQTFHLVVKPMIVEATGIPISPSIKLPQGHIYTTSNTQINVPTSDQNSGSTRLIDPVQQQMNFSQYPYFVPFAQTQTQQPYSINPQQQSVLLNQNFYPLQYYYVMINGMPYIAPIQYPYPLQYLYQYVPPPQVGAQAQQPFIAQIPDQQDVAARNQRRAATLWLIIKLGFLVYIFSQNASAERMILLYIFALVIFLYQTGRLRIVRRRRQRAVVPPAPNVANEFLAQPQPQVPMQQQNQEGIPTPQADPNDNIHSAPSSSSMPAQPSSFTLNNDPGNTNPSATSSTSDQQNNVNNNEDANDAPLLPQENARSITLQDIEHALWTFVASIVPTNAPDVGQQDDVGI